MAILRLELAIAVAVLVWGGSVCEGVGTFGFDIHHRYSDRVTGVLAVDGLPEKGSLPYYAAMAHRDRVFRHHRRGLLSSSAPLTFSAGNETDLLSSLGFLHYANVSVGSPELSFLVALDTGSDLFWLPCDCTSCVRGLKTSSGESITLNIYSPNASKTSDNVLCSSSAHPLAAITFAYKLGSVLKKRRPIETTLQYFGRCAFSCEVTTIRRIMTMVQNEFLFLLWYTSSQ